MSRRRHALRRRSLPSLLAGSGGMLLASGCGGPSPVPTSADVGRDPLATLEETAWNARSLEELRALPVQGSAEELSTWGELGGEDSVLDPARDLLATFLGTAYLDPAGLRGMEDEDTYEHISQATPTFWRDALLTAWDQGNRPFYAVALGEPFRTVGRPAIVADWYRAEQDEGPVLAFGATFAWTVIDAETRAVGVFAHRLGLVVEIDAEGNASAGDLRITIHGLDGCGMAEQDGLLVPTLADAEEHHAVQQATLEQLRSAPRITLEQLLEEDSEIFAKDDLTYLTCD